MKRNEHILRFSAKIFLPALFFILTGMLQPAFAQVPAPDWDFSTVTLEMKTGNGKVSVILPSDIRAGDKISGTVIADIKTVEGEVVAVNGKDYPVSNSKLTFSIPQGLSLIPLVLKSASGKHIGTAVLTVNTAPNFPGSIPAQPGSFVTPRLGQAGRNITIPGNFDGDVANTKVDVGGRGLPVIAESPRQTVVQIPAETPTGPGDLKIDEGAGNSQTAPFNVVSLQLKADKLNLMKGETTNLHISVTGLEGLKDNAGNIKLRVENASPQVVSMTFSPQFQTTGNAGTLLTRAVDLDGDNTIAFNEKLTGVDPGQFQINATMITELGDLIRIAIQKYWEDQLNAIAAMKEAAANGAKGVKGNTKVPKDLTENAARVRNLAKRGLWDDKGTALLDIKRSLQKEKDELTSIQKKIGAGSDTGKEIQKIKDALDKMAKGMGITLGK